MTAIIPAMRFTWRNQARQHAAQGGPGIIHYQPKPWVNVLLFYTQTRILAGILYYYPNGASLQPAGSVNLWVRPANARKGIGSKLVMEAHRRWTINWNEQDVTPEGLSLLCKLGLASPSSASDHP